MMDGDGRRRPYNSRILEYIQNVPGICRTRRSIIYFEQFQGVISILEILIYSKIMEGILKKRHPIIPLKCPIRFKH